MRWILALHIISMVAWFAGLFYLPRLFVYHALNSDKSINACFKTMERRLYYGIMAPAAILTVVFGAILLSSNIVGYLSASWMQIKLVLVIFLIVFHLICGKFLKDFKYDQNSRSTNFYRFFNEIPTLLLIAIVILVVVKP